MSDTFTLNVDSRVEKASNPNVNIADFDLVLTDEINLQERDGKKWHCCLHRLNVYNSVFNITDRLGNRTISYKDVNSGTWTTITLPEGIYGVDQLNAAFRRALKENGDSEIQDGERVYAFNLDTDYATQNFFFEFNQIGSTNYEIRVDQNIHERLGFPANAIIRYDDDFATRRGAGYIVDITGGIVENVAIHCDLITGSYRNSRLSNVIYSFPFDNKAGTLKVIEPLNLVYLPCVPSGSKVKTVHFTFRDGRGEILNLQGQSYVLDLEFKLK